MTEQPNQPVLGACETYALFSFDGAGGFDDMGYCAVCSRKRAEHQNPTVERRVSPEDAIREREELLSAAPS